MTSTSAVSLLPWIAQDQSKMPGDRRRQTADAGLQEHVGRGRWELAQGFANQGSVALQAARAPV